MNFGIARALREYGLLQQIKVSTAMSAGQHTQLDGWILYSEAYVLQHSWMVSVHVHMHVHVVRPNTIGAVGVWMNVVVLMRVPPERCHAPHRASAASSSPVAPRFAPLAACSPAPRPELLLRS